jgi:hypothetical protein
MFSGVERSNCLALFDDIEVGCEIVRGEKETRTNFVLCKTYVKLGAGIFLSLPTTY